MKFIHTADIHLGAHLDCFYEEYSILDSLESFALRQGISDVLVVGDIFDKPHPDQKIKDYLLRHLLKSDLRWYFVIGNHDYTDKDKRYHSLVYLELLEKVIPNLKVCKEGCFSSDKFNIITLSDRIISGEEAPIVVINKNPNILCWHGMLPGTTAAGVSDRTRKLVKRLLKKSNADYFALGDIHKPIRITKNCWYPGALIQKTYACEDGFIVVDGNSSKLVHLDVPKKITLNIELDEQDFVGDPEQNIIDVVRSSIADNVLLKLKFNLPVSVWASLNKKKIRDAFSDLIEIKLHNSPVLMMSKKKSSVKLTSIKDEIKFVINENDFDLNKDRLTKLCFKKLKEVG